MNDNERTIEKIIDLLFEIGEEHSDKTMVVFPVGKLWKFGLGLQKLLSCLTDVPATTDRIVKLEVVSALTGTPESTIYELIKKKTFPESVAVPGKAKSPGWRLSDISLWIADPENWEENRMAAMMAEDMDKQNG